MSLISLFYIIFLPVTLLINFILPRSQRYVWLFLANCFFYLSNDVRFVGGLLFCTVTTFAAGILLEKSEGDRKKVFLTICIAVNLLMLFFIRHFSAKIGFVPIGVSFYMLQSIGYLFDVYRKRITAERNPIRYAAFVSFFPTILSGPIQRGTGLLQQLKEGRDFDYDKAHSGLYYLLWGYLLKLVMADRLGLMVGFAYDRYETMPGAVMLWATFLYAVQLYCDFAGYSSLAIGTGMLLGFDLQENFAQPYFAVTVKDFWKRWHISLSSWLQDYVYIPLGGNRHGQARKYLNIMLTFIVSGLWHGTGLNYITWGALHGIYQIIGDVISSKSRKKKEKGGRIFKIIVTFALVDFAWIFFRADSLKQAVSIIYSIFERFHFKEMTYYGYYLLGGSKLNLLLLISGIIIVVMIDLIHEKKRTVEKFIMEKFNTGIRWAFYIALTLILLFVIVRCYGQAASTFIYGKF